jgi:glycosyltransferase involved in cell wall biosynthesis
MSKALGGPELSVVIPVLDEEANVSALLARLVQVLEAQDESFEVIFVDDGSTDGTFGRLRSLAASDPRVRVIRLARN